MTGRRKGTSPAALGTSSSDIPVLAGTTVKTGAAAAVRPPGAADDLGVANEVDWSGQSSGAVSPKGSAEADWGLWYIHGRAYDLTGFMDQHPGASAGLQRQAVGDTQNRSID
jgi:hypothetical protein